MFKKIARYILSDEIVKQEERVDFLEKRLLFFERRKKLAHSKETQYIPRTIKVSNRFEELTPLSFKEKWLLHCLQESISQELLDKAKVTHNGNYMQASVDFIIFEKESVDDEN